MRTAVITVVHDRGAHLRRQLEGLATSTLRPDLHIVVALGDPTVAALVSELKAPALVVEREAARPLPVAMGRNVGAAAAIRNAAELLVFSTSTAFPARSCSTATTGSQADPSTRTRS